MELTVARWCLSSNDAQGHVLPSPPGPASFPPENFQPGGSKHGARQVFPEGKVAAVTGGGQGIGGATAQALGEAGAAVAILDLDPARAEASAAGCGTSVSPQRGCRWT